MNCPQCGTSITADQQYCRACGASLEFGAVGPPAASAMSRSQQLRLAGFISVFAGLSFAIIGRMLFHTEMMVLIGVLMNFLGMFLVVYPSIVPQGRKRSPRPDVFRPAAMQAPQTTKKLTPMDDTFIIPSVTEGTTDLLRTPVTRTAKTESPLP